MQMGDSRQIDACTNLHYFCVSVLMSLEHTVKVIMMPLPNSGQGPVHFRQYHQRTLASESIVCF